MPLPSYHHRYAEKGQGVIGREYDLSRDRYRVVLRVTVPSPSRRLRELIRGLVDAGLDLWDDFRTDPTAVQELARRAARLEADRDRLHERLAEAEAKRDAREWESSNYAVRVNDFYAWLVGLRDEAREQGEHAVLSVLEEILGKFPWQKERGTHGQ